MFSILAEAAANMTPESIPVWAQITGGLSSLGISAWFVYYTTKYTIPRLQKQHGDAMNAQSLIHSETIKKYATTVDNLVSEFREEAKEQRESYQSRVDRSYDLVMASTDAVNSVAAAVERLTDHVNQLSRASEMPSRARR